MSRIALTLRSPAHTIIRMDETAAVTLFAWIDREVWLVTSRHGDERGGLIATFVTPASIVPDSPRVLVALAKQHHTWGVVEASGLFTLHLLCEGNLDLVWRFGLRSSREGDKFAGIETASPSGCPLLPGTIGWLDCKVEAKQDIGDRTVYTAEVTRGEVTHFAPPLTTSRLMELAPPGKLGELQRRRHQDGFRDAEAIRIWRGLPPAPPGE